MPVFSYQIIAGWNNVATLGNVESKTPSPAPANYLNDVLGDSRLDANTSYLVTSTPVEYNLVTTTAGQVQSGYSRQTWVFGLISDDALKYWRANYEGKMTIATKTDEVYDTYSNWNAILHKAIVTREQRIYLYDAWWWQDVVVPIILVGTAS